MFPNALSKRGTQIAAAKEIQPVNFAVGPGAKVWPEKANSRVL
jgi:hypothetical protein